MALIEKPGAYSGIDNSDYHRNPDLLPAPSISSSGLKTLLNRSPRHYFYDSPLNPERPPEKDKSHFRVGKAAHDVLLLSDRWPLHYHVTPEGFSLAKTKQFAEAIAEAEAARELGKCVLRYEEAALVMAMAEALRANPFATAALQNGESEVTLVWQDPETGVYLRARPDFLPAKRLIIPDLKTAADGSPKAFQRAIDAHGYHLSAAMYLDGIKAIYGETPNHWLHVVLEKEAPHVVSLYELPAEDIERGRWLARKAVRIFARCLETGQFPGYSDEPSQLGLPYWARKQVDDDASLHETAWSVAA